jgi:autotransporter-associated beta strand protein
LSGGNFFGALQGASGVNEWQGSVTIGTAGGTRIGVNTGTFTISGAIGGGVATNGIMFRPNTGTLILSGANNYLGDTVIVCSPGGMVRLAGGNNRLPVATKLIFGASTTSGSLDLNGTDQEVAGLSVGSGTANFITNSSLTLSKLNINTPVGTNSIWSQTLAGNLELIKAGPAMLTLSGVNIYSGLTTVSNGTLLVNGSIISAPTVRTNATLGGTGIIGGTVIVEAGGILAPGASVGTLTLSNAPTLNGTVLAELDQTNAPTADKLVLTAGTLTYGGSLVVTNIGPALTNGTFTLFNAPAYAGSFSSITLPPGGSLHWITNNLTVNGTITFTNNAPVASNFLVNVQSGGSVTAVVLGGKHPPTDSEGDLLTLTGVSTPAHGTASTDGTNVTYTATNNYAGADSFTYTITDSLGATGTATVNVTVIASGSGFNKLADPENLGDGSFRLSFLGVPGYNYALDWTTNLSAPVVWLPQLTNMAATNNGYLFFTNSQDTNAMNFWRTRHVP